MKEAGCELARARRDDDTPRIRQLLQTRRKVRRLTNDGLLLSSAYGTDNIADHNQAGGDPDAHLQPAWGARIELWHSLDNSQPRANSTLSIKFMRARIAEIDEDAIAHKLGDKALVALNHADARALVCTDDVVHVLRIKLGGHCRRTHQ